MPVAQECQPFATAIENLEADITSIRATLPGLSAADRWKALADIGTKQRSIAENQRNLDVCQRQHAQVAYQADVVVFDTTGAAPGSRIARLWDMGGDAPVVVQEVPVQPAGTFTFTTHVTDAPVGLTIQQNGASPAPGVDFRAGPLPALPGIASTDPAAGRVELVLGPVLTITADDVVDWLSAVPLPQQISVPIPSLPVVGDGHTAEITIASLDVSLRPDRIRIAGSGTARTSSPLLGALAAPFTLEVPITLGLPVAPGSEQVCDVILRGTPNLTVDGPLGPILTTMMPFFLNFVATATLPQLRSALNAEVPRAIAGLFGLQDVPPSATASLRQFEITPTEITLSAALGAFGDTLSTYQP